MEKPPLDQETKFLPLGEIYGDIKSITRIFYLFITLLLFAFILGIFIVLSTNDIFAVALIGAGILPVLASLYLIRRKKFELSAVLLAIILMTLITATATAGLGIHHISILGYPAILIVSSLVIRKRTMAILTLYAVACAAWLVFGELSGIYTPEVLVHSVAGDFFSVAVILITTAFMVRSITETMFQSSLRLQAELKERKLAEEQVRQQAGRAEVLAALSQVLTQATQDYQLVLNTVVRRSAEIIGDGASIFLYSPESEFLQLAAVYNPDPKAIDIFRDEMTARPVRVNEGAYAQVFEKDRPILIPSVPLESLMEHSSPERREYYKKLPLYSMMLAPLHVKGKTFGVIGLGRHAPGKDYTPEDLTFLQDIADRSALAMLNAQMYNELERELTERKRADAERERLIQELADKNTELERFTYTVSHDLKSPLVTINGFLGFLEKDVASGDMEHFNIDVQRIHEAVNKMHTLLGELLELSRIGRMMNTPEIIPFSDLVHNAMDNVHGQLEAGKVSVHIQPNLPAVFGDRQRLIEVLQNLLDNAAKFMGDQPEPRIEIGQSGEEDGKPVFFIKDNGIGIQPEFHERIFGLFNQLNPTTKGTGIGLAIVKRIIEVHGGRIRVESNTGKGAKFYFSLPGEKSRQSDK